MSQSLLSPAGYVDGNNTGIDPSNNTTPLNNQNNDNETESANETQSVDVPLAEDIDDAIKPSPSRKSP